MALLQSDLRLNSSFGYINPVQTNIAPESTSTSSCWVGRPPVRSTTSCGVTAAENTQRKPKICTADQLHYVAVPNSDWNLALWRYLPSPQAPPRNHPLLLLSGVATNAIGYDLSPESSFARFMSGQGFDTWILEVRGSGLSTHAPEFGENEELLSPMSEQIDSVNCGTNDIFSPGAQSSNHGAFAEPKISLAKEEGTHSNSGSGELQSVSKLPRTSLHLSGRLSDFLSEGVVGASQNSAIVNQIRDLRLRVLNIIEEGQQLFIPQLFDWQEQFSTIVEDFQKQLDLIVKYDWDFDHYLQEDIPAAMMYIRTQCKPKDGKLLAIGHSMGGILLYAMLSRCCFEGRDSQLAAVAAIGSSLDYTSSKSSLKVLLPLADPAQALRVPIIPVGALLAAAYPFASRPPYIMSWLNPQISARDMLHPKLFEKLVLNNFCTVPSKLLLQLMTAFEEHGLRNRSGTFYYQNHLGKSNVPILAVAGDQDLICPPEAVYETAKFIPKHLLTFKVFGEPGGPHYGHYDLVGGRLAVYQVYPCIIEFLKRYDSV